jgi:hypothetical protein
MSMKPGAHVSGAKRGAGTVREIGADDRRRAVGRAVRRDQRKRNHDGHS